MNALNWMLFFAGYVAFALVLLQASKPWTQHSLSSAESQGFCVFLKVLSQTPNTRLAFGRPTNQTCATSYRLSESLELVR